MPQSSASQSSPARPSNWPLLYTAITLTTLATLLLELSLTRIFSVVFYYHFAFLAISIALFGLGAGGVFSYVISAWPGSLYRKLGIVSLINAGMVLGAVMFVLTRGADVTTFDFGVIYFTTALPFLGSGIVVSSASSRTSGPPKRDMRMCCHDIGLACHVPFSPASLIGRLSLQGGAGELCLRPRLNWVAFRTRTRVSRA